MAARDRAATATAPPRWRRNPICTPAPGGARSRAGRSLIQRLDEETDRQSSGVGLPDGHGVRHSSSCRCSSTGVCLPQSCPTARLRSEYPHKSGAVHICFAPVGKHPCTQIGCPNRVGFIEGGPVSAYRSVAANPKVNPRRKASNPRVDPTIAPTGTSFSCSDRLVGIFLSGSPPDSKQDEEQGGHKKGPKAGEHPRGSVTLHD